MGHPHVFSMLLIDLKSNIDTNRHILYELARKNPNMGYQKVNELARFVGSRYNVDLQLHFVDRKKLLDIQLYGSENIGIIIDKFRKRFPIDRMRIKDKALEILGNVEVKDAYMYEGKEGLKIILAAGRIELLPGSIHIWCMVDENIKNFVDWVMENVYLLDV
jgi:hypothetical protein